MSKSVKILIADDNKEFSRILERYLSKFDFIKIVDCVNTDDDEIESIEKYNPDIVITDLIRNNVYSGLEIIRKYNKKKPNLKFLVISAEYQTIEANVCIDGYIQKPFSDYEKIIEEINRIMQVK